MVDCSASGVIAARSRLMNRGMESRVFVAIKRGSSLSSLRKKLKKSWPEPEWLIQATRFVKGHTPVGEAKLEASQNALRY